MLAACALCLLNIPAPTSGAAFKHSWQSQALPLGLLEAFRADGTW